MDCRKISNVKSNPIRTAADYRAAYIAAVLAVGLLVGAGLIPEWGRWHTHNFAYHRQVEAFLHGSLSLSDKPNELLWDMAWSRNGVQQVWGLGVPAWQLPFDILSRTFGKPFFPDRLSFGIAIAFVAYCVMRLCSSIRREYDCQQQFPGAFPALLLLVLFPPFVTLCRTRFNVYEEAQAYAYLCGIAMLVWLLWFIRYPTILRYTTLMLFGGLTIFVRPTLLAYVLSTLLFAWFHTIQLRWPQWKSWMGVGLVCFGGALLFLTNLERFGSGFEFGHGLNLNESGEMRYASRFDHPFRKEPVRSAATELASSLFLSGGKMNGMEWYKEAFFHAQSPTFRWREMYFKVYDLSYLAMIASVWLCSLVVSIRYWREQRKIADLPYWAILGLWSIVSCLPLTVFYLRFPFLCSRYLVDFAPSFAAALLGFVGMVVTLVAKNSASRIPRILVLAAVAVWWGVETCTPRIHPAYDGPLSLKREEMEGRMDANKKTVTELKVLPRQYIIGTNPEEFGIPFNCSGWDMDSGVTEAAISIFLQDPGRLELEIAPINGIPTPQAAYLQIRAKIGLEWLELTTTRTTTNGAILEFERPRNSDYQTGLQVAFIGFVDTADLSTNASPFRLLRVRW